MTSVQAEQRNGERQLTAEEIEKLSSDSEGGPARRVDGWLGWLTSAACLAIGGFALYWTQFAINTTVYRSTFLAACLALIFILYPLTKQGADGYPQTRRATPEELVACLLAAAAIAYLLHHPNPMFAIYGRSSVAYGLGVLLALCFLSYPLLVSNRFLARLQPVDWIFAAVALYTAVYLSLNIDAYKSRAMRPAPEELVLGLALILLVLEATRRAVGWILPAIALVFLVYCYAGSGWLIPDVFEHRGFTLNRIIGQNFLTLEGIFTTPLDVAATFIILFTIYGAVLDRGGAGRFFIEWAFALFGKNPSPSAPGRAVVASGFLLGTVSGSGVATTVTVSSLAWPMLKRSGYSPNVAGGMLSAAGIGATLSPPTLGAAAFIIAEFLDVDYLQILIYATIPTILYYVSCWLMTEADSRRMNVSAVRTSDASLWELTKAGGYHFISLGAIAIFLVLGFTSFMAVYWSIVVAFVLSMLRPDSQLVTRSGFLIGCGAALAAHFFGLSDIPRTLGMHELFDGRLSVASFWGIAAAVTASGAQSLLAAQAGRDLPAGGTAMIEALIDGTRSTLAIVAVCACAGVIVSVVNLTGLGLTISGIIIAAGGSNVFLILLMAAIAMWILGLSVPVTASYIIAAVMLVPALVKVGVPPAAAHMFMFYYAVLADVSPPTALAPFAASAITGGEPFRTTMQAWKYTLPAFVVPFMFCLTPDGAQLLMLVPTGTNAAGAITYGLPSGLLPWLSVLWVTITACLALVGLCIMFTGQALEQANWTERVLCLIGGSLLLAPSAYADAVGLAFLGAGLALHWFRVRTARATPPLRDTT
ncbi:MAG: TRAP transporter fused permease subunit [Phreatobacter sp.]|uniref:TRAP transporter permease n=1 Tax=Phreatobacter sp. TaxID=1966341 RepID=UPI001A5B5A74|nr:TRAP transporter fused permease subunit [Phreatobacter sp.]MBL8569669.1 TRAP transporter fused permease subunit [Phreatobacter sp.]